MITLGLDLGSSKCGLCAIDGLTIVGAATIPVNPKQLKPTIEAIASALEVSRAEKVAIEWSARPYTPTGATPQAMASIAYAREVMAVILDRVEQLCEARSIPVIKVACATWRARIGVSRRRTAGVEGLRQGAWRRLNPRRDTTDRRVGVALDRLLGDAAAGLVDVHQRDAAGVALGVDRAPAERAPVVPRVKREPKPPRQSWYTRKHGTRYSNPKHGPKHPSDEAFDRMMAERS